MPGQLTPFARISAAIEKLERLKAESTPGPWQGRHSNTVDHDGVSIPDEDLDPSELEPFYAPPATGCFMIAAHSFPVQQANADLIVTLHCAIDPVLDILRGAEKAERESGYFTTASFAGIQALALADSILGGES